MHVSCRNLCDNLCDETCILNVHCVLRDSDGTETSTHDDLVGIGPKCSDSKDDLKLQSGEKQSANLSDKQSGTSSGKGNSKVFDPKLHVEAPAPIQNVWQVRRNAQRESLPNRPTNENQNPATVTFSLTHSQNQGVAQSSSSVNGHRNEQSTSASGRASDALRNHNQHVAGNTRHAARGKTDGSNKSANALQPARSNAAPAVGRTSVGPYKSDVLVIAKVRKPPEFAEVDRKSENAGERKPNDSTKCDSKESCLQGGADRPNAAEDTNAVKGDSHSRTRFNCAFRNTAKPASTSRRSFPNRFPPPYAKRVTGTSRTLVSGARHVNGAGDSLLMRVDAGQHDTVTPPNGEQNDAANGVLDASQFDCYTADFYSMMPTYFAYSHSSGEATVPSPPQSDGPEIEASGTAPTSEAEQQRAEEIRKYYELYQTWYLRYLGQYTQQPVTSGDTRNDSENDVRTDSSTYASAVTRLR